MHLHIYAAERVCAPICIERTTYPLTLMVDVEESASATVCLDLRGGETGECVCNITVALAPQSSLDFLCIEACDAPARVRITQEGEIAEHASLTWRNVTVGSEEVRQNLRSTVRGRGSCSAIEWIFSARGCARHTLSAHNTFAAPDGSGEIVIKGIAADRAHLCFDGAIAIAPEGTGTETHLTQNVLMLDPTAHVNAIPALDIRTNSVRASHSATVSRITDDDLFYIVSRGVPIASARALIAEGFLVDLTDRIPHPVLRARVLQVLSTPHSHPSRS